MARYCPSWVTHLPAVSSLDAGFAWSQENGHTALCSTLPLSWLLPLTFYSVGEHSCYRLFVTQSPLYPVRWLVYSLTNWSCARTIFISSGFSFCTKASGNLLLWRLLKPTNTYFSWDYCKITATVTASFCRTISSLFPCKLWYCVWATVKCKSYNEAGAL